MSAPVGISVTERTEGTRRVLEADGWEWVTGQDFGDDEPRIADASLAPKLGMTVPHIRELSERHERAGNVSPRVYRIVRQTGGRPGNQRWYTEADALFLVTRSEKAEAVALTKAMIQVVIAVRRHLLSTVAVVAHSRRPPVPRLPPSPAPVPEARQLPPPMRRFRDLPEWGALRAAARLDVSSDALDVLGAWHMPMLDDIEHARTMVTPAAVVAMARTFQSHLSPSALAHEAAAARLAH